MSARDICVLGSLNQDLVIRTERFAKPGETLLAGPFETHPGGKGANQAVAAARLGASVALIGAVGSDANGESLVANAEREGVDCRFVRRDAKLATGVAVITVDARGENQILVAPGANASVGAGDVERARDAIERAKLVLAQLETPLEALERAFAIAARVRVRTLLNAAPARALPRELLASLDVLIVNRTEAETLAGRAGEAGELARELAASGPELVVVTLGALGALAFDRGSGRIVQREAFEVVAVDSTAAGDAFTAAFAVSLARGEALESALARAAAAGALACTKRGAQPSLPRAADVEECLVRVQRSRSP